MVEAPPWVAGGRQGAAALTLENGFALSSVAAEARGGSDAALASVGEAATQWLLVGACALAVGASASGGVESGLLPSEGDGT